MYKLLKNYKTDELLNIIFRVEDNCFISMSEDNTDYAEYLKWLDEGNTPLPADTQPE
jgi:hypothetical protein